jgi:hypothetical protein
MQAARIFAFVVVLVYATNVNAQARGIEVLHFDEARDVEVAPRGPGTGSSPRGPLAMRFNSLNREFVLQLEPNGRVDAIARRLTRDGSVTAYRGKLVGYENSWIRIVRSGSGPSGLVWDGTTLFALETSVDSLIGHASTTVFRLDDIYVDGHLLSCGTGPSRMSAATAFRGLVSEARNAAESTATLSLDMGVVADFEFSAANSGDPAAALLTRMNNVDGIFAEQVGVQLTLRAMDVFDSELDPFNESDASALLEELGVYRLNTQAQSTGLTHLFTGRNLDGTTVGIAYFSALCSDRFSAGLSESRRGPALDSLIAAHEIGHNFGAPHDGDPNQACASTPEAFLMAPSLSLENDTFSQCSLDQMEAEISVADCLVGISFADVGVSGSDAEPSFLAGTEFDYVVTAENRGAEATLNTYVDLTFGSGLEVLAAAASAGTCDAPQATIRCSLGDIPGGTARDITVRLRSDLVGEHALLASVTSENDIDSSNDSFSATLTVLAAVNLALSGEAISAERDSQTSLRVTLRNQASLAATDIEVTGQFSAGLEPEFATLGGSACSISGQTFTCSVIELAEYSFLPLDMVFTGVAAGTATINLAATSAIADTNLADNSLELTIDIFGPPSEQQSGGGGAAGMLAVLGLAALALRRRLGAQPGATSIFLKPSESPSIRTCLKISERGRDKAKTGEKAQCTRQYMSV